ncbi:MAG: 16S rRNA (guanine(966)-N(2))-methyltransferase RsmD [Firmicutes bacterium]|nr:16S rRNA (guanine(966)-N(2))-methyltransferase RsmD [Bacillota bacterium]
MRVIAGAAKGHRLTSVPGLKTRPTTDRVKESLFNILGQQVVDASFLDLFAGSGGIGIEALSRGAKEVVFIDHHKKCGEVIKANLAKTKLQGEVYVRDVFSALDILGRKQRRFDIIFLDPPYNQGVILPVLEKISINWLLAENGLIVVEHGRKEEIKPSVLNFNSVRTEQYSDTNLSFYRYKEESSED